MSQPDPGDLSSFSMLDLFRMEVETQSAILTSGLLGLEQDRDVTLSLGELMRAAHSLKGAARIVGRKAAVRVAHAMEDCLVAAQKKKQAPSSAVIDTLLAGTDLLSRIAQVSDEVADGWEAEHRKDIETFLTSLSSLAGALEGPGGQSSPPQASRETRKPLEVESSLRSIEAPEDAAKPVAASDRGLRVTVDALNHLMELAGEARVTSRWLEAFRAGLLRLKRNQRQLGQVLDALGDSLASATLDERTAGRLTELRMRAADCHRSVADRLTDFDLFDRRFVGFSTRLYHTVLDCRMRPFSDGTQGFHRMVRDVARSLGKKVKLEIQGGATAVDRDILERLKAPLDHLVRNSLDHGIEPPVVRVGRGKPEQGTVTLQACHRAGKLLVTVEDDGSGIDSEAVRDAVVQRRLTTLETTQKMTNSELLEFLFLPGFTLKDSVSEISGRGVGLDVVQTMVKEVGGRVRTSSVHGQGTCFQLELPLTLSVVRTLLVEIAGEPYALPLAHIDKALKLPKERIESLQGRQHFTLGQDQIGLVAAHQILDLASSPNPDSDVSVVVLGDKTARYGLVIDRFLGEKELVVRALDPRLGKVKNISAAALMPDGGPVLIIDVDDLKRSIENLAAGRHLLRVESQTGIGVDRKRKRVLVVDDSLTVRELERKLLGSRGYSVDVAVDGMDGWNAVRTGHYDLLVTDIDMPRLDGIDFLKLIRKDHRLKALPVIIVSYKDRQEDRNRGLEAGADYYLTKASFHDETLLQVVADLIGGSDA